MRKILGMLTLALSLSAIVTSCNLQSASSQQPSQTSSSGAETADIGKQFSIPKNAQNNTTEQQNIMDRLKITSDPTRVLWLHRLAPMSGNIIDRVSVRGKVTSSHKRLEPVSCATGMSNGQGVDVYYGAKTPDGHRTSELLQADGTYGGSDDYIFWFSTDGHYFQLSEHGTYLISDIPIDLDNQKDKITGLYNLDKAAYEWAQAQEKKLSGK